MSELHPVDFILKERHNLVGRLDNERQSLREDGNSAEADEYSAIDDELWEHTSHPTIDLPDDTPVTVSLTPDHWFLLAGSLDVDAVQSEHRHPEESERDLRLRDRIVESLGDAFPVPAQPSAPKRCDVSVGVGELGCYQLFDALNSDHWEPVVGERLEYDAWIDEGNGLAVGSYILTGTRDGVIHLTGELLAGEPPLTTKAWDDIAEHSWPFRTVDAPGPPPSARTLRVAAPEHESVILFDFDPVWPSTCMYRIRVSVRGRDAGTGEQHLIQAWRAPSAPPKLIKATDITGRRRRTGP